MTSRLTHLWRLLTWGRILARHGALLGIEQSPVAPAGVRRLARIARLGAFLPKTPDYAGAFEKIGPAAIKLGQTLATRPDLVGEDAARDLQRLQDTLPALSFDKVKAAVEQSLDAPLDSLFQSIDPEPVGAASVAQVHKAVTSDGRTVAVKILRPGIEAKFASDIETYEWIAAHAAARGGELARLRPREVIATFKQWTLRELDLRREAAAASELRAMMRAEDGGWPRKMSATSNRQRLQTRGVSCDRNRVRAKTVARSTTHTVCRLSMPVQSRLVEASENRRPGCRTQTGHARRFIAGRFAGRGFDSPRVHHCRQNTGSSVPGPSAGPDKLPSVVGHKIGKGRT